MVSVDKQYVVTLSQEAAVAVNVILHAYAASISECTTLGLSEYQYEQIRDLHRELPSQDNSQGGP